MSKAICNTISNVKCSDSCYEYNSAFNFPFMFYPDSGEVYDSTGTFIGMGSMQNNTLIVDFKTVEVLPIERENKNTSTPIVVPEKTQSTGFTEIETTKTYIQKNLFES